MTQIYEIISLIHPETVYVGKHKGDIFKDNYWGSGTVIKNYVDKYGKENFERRICNTISDDKNIWSEFERFWIAYYRESGWNVLNIKDGGEEGPIPKFGRKHRGGYHFKMPPEACKKISTAQTGESNSMYGKHSWNYGLNISGQSGKIRSAEHIQKIKDGKKRARDNGRDKGNTGKIFSIETKKKMSISAKNRKNNNQ